MSRDQYLTNSGVLYRFSSAVIDLSQRRMLETVVSGSKGLRDTAELTVRRRVAAAAVSRCLTFIVTSVSLSLFVPQVTQRDAQDLEPFNSRAR